MRKDPLVEGCVYHVFSRGIMDLKIFSARAEFARMLEAMRYYQRDVAKIKLSRYLRLQAEALSFLRRRMRAAEGGGLRFVSIICYALMPTHIHFVLKQVAEDGISIFMANLLNSYTRYFNTRHERKGTLWEGRFKSVLVRTQAQLLHLTRYIHLNPVTAGLVERPEEWAASSYREYLRIVPEGRRICDYGNLIDMGPSSYAKFVEDRIGYQRQLARIRKLLLEHSTYEVVCRK
ncbi:MAG: transposase [bacterium]|nr:transposase [bacterium]